mgnify:CR=1 FL=1
MRLQEHVQTGPSCDRHKGGFLVFYLLKACQIHVRNRRNIYTRDIVEIHLKLAVLFHAKLKIRCCNRRTVTFHKRKPPLKSYF